MDGRNQTGLKWIIALVRVAMGVIFLFFGEYKIASPAFAHGGIQKYLSSFLDGNMVVHWYRPFLEKVVLPHAPIFGYLFGAGELLVGTALVTGVMVRPAAIGGIFMMLNLLFSQWNGVGPNARIWQYFGAQLDHLCPLMLLLIFLAESDPKLSLQRFFSRGRRA
jgi:thiosulfate dehydrogenase [quinone] large subunit